jgi:hypothetical protein
MHGWDPRAQLLRDWLTDRLQRAYSFFQGKTGKVMVTELLAAGKLSVILDGLDEIPVETRPHVLTALSEQASTFRIIILTRSAEMAFATEDAGHLEGAAALELQPVSSVAATSYLKRARVEPAPRGWRDLMDRIREAPDSPLAQALNNPLALTLVRFAYREEESVQQLLDFCDASDSCISAEDVTAHLLDQVLPVAYRQRPGQPAPAYDLQSAQKALRCIAILMNNGGTRDLAWWRVRELTESAMTAFHIGTGRRLVKHFLVSLTFLEEPDISPGRLIRIGRLPSGFRLQVIMRSILPRALIVGLLAGWAGALAFGLTRGVAVGLGLGLVAGPARGALVGVHVYQDESSFLNPTSLWRDTWIADLATWLLLFLPTTLSLSALLLHGEAFMYSHIPWDSTTSDKTKVEVVRLIPASFALLWGLASLVGFRAWVTFVAFAQLAACVGTPLHLMRFLEDAREREVLRTIGPVYQFRHATLQDRLADGHSYSTH